MISKNKIIALKAFKDNYIWALHGSGNHDNRIIIIDPGEAQPVLDYIQTYDLFLEAVFITHHHADHTGGLTDLLAHYPSIPVYSSQGDHVPGVTQSVQEGQSIQVSHFEYPIEILEIPGHTLGHLAYIFNGALFCGDTLFSMGCGKIFEGTVEQMYSSLEKMKQLPTDTLVYCGHEYTLANLRFAQHIDPNNSLLEQYQQTIQGLRDNNKASLPSVLATELQLNPFLRCDDPVIIAATEHYRQQSLSHPIAVLSALREWKNHFS